jgi:hypothetical protein
MVTAMQMYSAALYRLAGPGSLISEDQLLTEETVRLENSRSKANPVSDILDFTVLAIRHLQGEFFNYEYQDWIEIIFADEKKIVSAMLLKTESMDNFGLTTKFILSSGLRLIDVIITGYFVKKTSIVNKSTYYALEFRFRDNDPETVKDIETFLEACDVTKITGLNF